MSTEGINILLADDDTDDCDFFKDALDDIPVNASLSIVHNGIELMLLLSQKMNDLPDVLFLDLNMPRKNGFECLNEIKLHEKLMHLPVIIFSTSFDKNMVNLLKQQGATYYIRKPAEFSELKNVIHKAIKLITASQEVLTDKENFVLAV